MPFAIEVEGRFVGQLTVNNIVRGSAQFCAMGYWIDQAYAGRGIVPRAVAMAIDHCFGAAGLHRVEICIRPENTNSLRVVEKLGMHEVGLAPGSCTSTAPGATTGSTRSPSRSVPAGWWPGSTADRVSGAGSVVPGRAQELLLGLGSLGMSQSSSAWGLRVCRWTLPGPVRSTTSPSPLRNVDFQLPTLRTW